MNPISRRHAPIDHDSTNVKHILLVLEPAFKEKANHFIQEESVVILN
jgi:hypothetical protein